MASDSKTSLVAADVTAVNLVKPGGEPSRVVVREESRSFAFKLYILTAMTVMWSLYAVLIRYTRTRGAAAMYHSTTVVCCSELLKLLVALFMLLRSHNFDTSRAYNEFNTDFLSKPRQFMKVSVPSLVYSLQNNLIFVALSNLTAALYQVTAEIKTVTTAVAMVLMLGRSFSKTRWLAIVLCFLGAACVQFDAITGSSVGNNPNTGQPVKQNYWLGLSAVLTTCCTSAFAGVYFERVLKDSQASLWIRSIQMYSAGLIVAVFTCLVTQGSSIVTAGFFSGYDGLVFAIVFFQAFAGVFVSMVLKYLDNLMKSFAASVSISIVCVISYFWLGSTLGPFFVCGTITVCFSVILYHYAA